MISWQLLICRESCKKESHPPFVKTYATLGYLWRPMGYLWDTFEDLCYSGIPLEDKPAIPRHVMGQLRLRQKKHSHYFHHMLKTLWLLPVKITMGSSLILLVIPQPLDHRWWRSWLWWRLELFKRMNAIYKTWYDSKPKTAFLFPIRCVLRLTL